MMPIHPASGNLRAARVSVEYQHFVLRVAALYPDSRRLAGNLVMLHNVLRINIPLLVQIAPIILILHDKPLHVINSLWYNHGAPYYDTIMFYVAQDEFSPEVPHPELTIALSWRYPFTTLWDIRAGKPYHLDGHALLLTDRVSQWKAARAADLPVILICT